MLKLRKNGIQLFVIPIIKYSESSCTMANNVLIDLSSTKKLWKIQVFYVEVDFMIPARLVPYVLTWEDFRAKKVKNLWRLELELSKETNKTTETFLHWTDLLRFTLYLEEQYLIVISTAERIQIQRGEMLGGAFRANLPCCWNNLLNADLQITYCGHESGSFSKNYIPHIHLLVI